MDLRGKVSCHADAASVNFPQTDSSAVCTASVCLSAPPLSVHAPDEMIDAFLGISPRPGLGHQSALGQLEV